MKNYQYFFSVLSKLKSETFKSFIIYIFGAFLMKGVQFFLIPVYTSVLSPEEFGMMELLNGFITIFSIILSLGMGTVVSVEYFHLDGEKKKDFFRTINSIYTSYILIIWLLISIVCFVFRSKLFSETVPPFLLLISLLISFFYFFQNNYLAVLQMRKEALKLTVLKIIIGLGSGIMILFLVFYLRIGILGVFLGNLVFLLFSISFALFEYHKKVGFEIKWIEINTAIKYIKLGLPYVAGTLAYWMLTSADRWIILNQLGEHQLGIYSAAYKISSVVDPLLISPVVAAYTPYVFERFKNNIFNQKLPYIIPAAIFIFIVIGLLSQFFAYYLLDKKFHDSLLYIPYISISFGLFFLCQISASILVYRKQTFALLVNIILASIINISLNYYFCLKFGLYGVTFAYFVGNLCWLILTLIQVKLAKR